MFVTIFSIFLFFGISMCRKCEFGEFEMPNKVLGKFWPSCQPCDIGYFCPDRKSKVKCDAGYVCDSAGNMRPQKCPRGYRCPDGIQKIPMTGPTEIVEDVKPAQCPHSPKGFYCSDSNSPLIYCPEGFFCGECDMKVGDLKDNRCPEGFFCPGSEKIFTEGLGSEGLENGCKYEYFCPVDEMKIKCPPGFTCGARGLSEPETCKSGTYCSQYGMKSSERCGGDFFCPYHQMSERFLCQKSCGYVSEDGKECMSAIEYDGSIFPDFEFECDSWFCYILPVRFVYLIMHIGSNAGEIGTKVISKGFVLVFWTEFMVLIVIAAPFFFIISLVSFMPKLLLPNFASFAFGGTSTSVRMGMLFLSLSIFLLWLGSMVSSVEGVNKAADLIPINIKVRTREVEGDPCLNLRVQLSITPSQRIEDNSQMIKINSFGGDEGLYPDGKVIRLPEIRKDETVILETYLESDSHFDLERLNNKELDVSFSPIRTSTYGGDQSRNNDDCSYPLYFVANLKGSTEKMDRNKRYVIDFKVIDVVENYFSELLRQIGRVNIGYIGAMGVGKSTIISTMQSMLMGEVKLLKSVMNIKKHNTIEVSYFSFFDGNLNFVDTFGLRNYESELLEGEEIAKSHFEDQLLFVKFVMSSFVRMLHNGYFEPGFRRKRFAQLVVENTREILRVIQRRSPPGIKLDDDSEKVEKIIRILASDSEMFPEEKRAGQSMNATVYVASGSIGDSDIHEFAVIHRDYINNKKSDHSRFFIFYKDSVCDESTTPSFGANPQDVTRSDVYLHRQRNVFSTDLQASVILKKFLLEIADSQGMKFWSGRNYKPQNCFSGDLLQSYSFRRIEGGFGPVQSTYGILSWFVSKHMRTLCVKMLGVGIVISLIMYVGIYIYALYLRIITQKRIQKKTKKKKKKKKKRKKMVVVDIQPSRKESTDEEEEEGEEEEEYFDERKKAKRKRKKKKLRKRKKSGQEKENEEIIFDDESEEYDVEDDDDDDDDDDEQGDVFMDEIKKEV